MRRGAIPASATHAKKAQIPPPACNGFPTGSAIEGRRRTAAAVFLTEQGYPAAGDADTEGLLDITRFLST